MSSSFKSAKAKQAERSLAAWLGWTERLYFVYMHQNISHIYKHLV